MAGWKIATAIAAAIFMAPAGVVVLVVLFVALLPLLPLLPMVFIGLGAARVARDHRTDARTVATPPGTTAFAVAMAARASGSH